MSARTTLLALICIAGCGSDGVHHLADAPPGPDVAIADAPATDAPTDSSMMSYDPTGGIVTPGELLHGLHRRPAHHQV